MHSLATWWDALKVAKKENYFDTKSIGEVESFLYEPMEWSSKNGVNIVYKSLNFLIIVFDTIINLHFDKINLIKLYNC